MGIFESIGLSTKKNLKKNVKLTRGQRAEKKRLKGARRKFKRTGIF